MTSRVYAQNENNITFPVTIPPLENGDRLTRTEFEYRYRAMPDLKKDEEALLTGNLVQVLTVLQQGLATETHQIVVEDLSQHC